MIIICINLLRCRERAEEIHRLWQPLGQLLFMAAFTAEECESENEFCKKLGRKLVPGEVACRRSHNRALAIVRQANQTCCIIEDDAVPLEHFQWPTFRSSGRMLLHWHGTGKWGSAAYLAAPDTPPIFPGNAADHWPSDVPLWFSGRLLVGHDEGETTIHGRNSGREEV